MSGTPKRRLKKALIPGYGQKDMGWLLPKKKLYNKFYNSTTIDLVKLFKSTNNNPSAKVIKHEGLLNIGAITQEEVDAKKKELLDL